MHVMPVGELLHSFESIGLGIFHKLFAGLPDIGNRVWGYLGSMGNSIFVGPKSIRHIARLRFEPPDLDHERLRT